MDQSHGRHETRQVFAFAVTPEQTGFPYAAQGALIIRTTHHLKACKVTEDIEIVISSRPQETLDGAQIQVARRGHWGIESIHYIRDGSFGEDLSTVRTGHGPRNMACLRNLIVGLCALDGARMGRKHSSLPTFRRTAQNDRSVAIELVTRSLLPAPE